MMTDRSRAATGILLACLISAALLPTPILAGSQEGLPKWSARGKIGMTADGDSLYAGSKTVEVHKKRVSLGIKVDPITHTGYDYPVSEVTLMFSVLARCVRI
jgi:hypothetical protein